MAREKTENGIFLNKIICNPQQVTLPSQSMLRWKSM